MLTMGIAGLDSCLEKLDDWLERLHRYQQAVLALILLAPALSILGFFGIYPIFYAGYMSLFGGKFGQGKWVGLGNYTEALGRSDFWHSVSTTLFYVMGTIPLTLCISFVIAYGLYQIARFRGLFRTLYFLPYVTSAVAAAMIWRLLLNPQFGLVNALFLSAGIPVQQWLQEPRGVLSLLTGGAIAPGIGPSLALCCIMLFDVWHGVGFMVVVFLAGLTAIPRELEEAARIDGATGLQLIGRVIVPLLSPTLFFLVIVGSIRAFQAFNSFYALTGNGRGPVDSTQNLTVYIYANFYEYQYYGYGTAVATLLCMAIVGLTLIQWRVVGRKVHYQ